MCVLLFVWVRDYVWTCYKLICLILRIIVSMFVVMRGSRSCQYVLIASGGVYAFGGKCVWGGSV